MCMLLVLNSYTLGNKLYAGFPNLAVQLPRITVQDLCTNNDIYIGRWQVDYTITRQKVYCEIAMY